MRLIDEKNQVTRLRIRRAAMAVLAQRGLRATIDEIAITAGISPRTVFRHYAGYDDLVADAIGAMSDELWAPVDGLPDPAVDLDDWLWRLALAAQTRNAQIIGRAFWDFYNPPTDTSEVILRALEERRTRRGQAMDYLATAAWRHAGGSGPAPRELHELFLLLFSGYVTYPLAAEFGHGHEQAATLTADVLGAYIRFAVADQAG